MAFPLFGTDDGAAKVVDVPKAGCTEDPALGTKVSPGTLPKFFALAMGIISVAGKPTARVGTAVFGAGGLKPQGSFVISITMLASVEE